MFMLPVLKLVGTNRHQHRRGLVQKKMDFSRIHREMRERVMEEKKTTKFKHHTYIYIYFCCQGTKNIV